MLNTSSQSVGGIVTQDASSFSLSTVQHPSSSATPSPQPSPAELEGDIRAAFGIPADATFNPSFAMINGTPLTRQSQPSFSQTPNAQVFSNGQLFASQIVHTQSLSNQTSNTPTPANSTTPNVAGSRYGTSRYGTLANSPGTPLAFRN